MNIHITSYCDIGDLPPDGNFWPAYYDTETRTIHLNTIWFWWTVEIDGRVRHPERVFIRRFTKAIAHETIHHVIAREVRHEDGQHWALHRIGL